ncbi:MAG TPA: dienelactone hydrolase family protein, partial [Bryobacteraceae bacterium]
MKFKKPSGFPQKPLDLFNEYQHAHIDRRSFLDDARRFVVSGLTAGAVLEMMRPNYAWAQVGKET